MNEHEHLWLNVTTVADPLGTDRWECGCGATGFGFMGGPPAKAEPTLIAAFAAGLKAHLRATGRGRWASVDDPRFTAVTYDELDAAIDAAIDAFAAEFQRKP